MLDFSIIIMYNSHRFSPKAGKIARKVAETAEISKTAPKIMVLSNKWRP